jgi:RNA polymerase sigma-70 factor, ECF subfamily
VAKMRTRSPWLVTAVSVNDPLRSPDAELVRRSQRDLDAFVELYDRYVDAVFRYCNRRLPTDAAEDATSITFLNAMAAIPKMTPRQVESFRAWLFTIAHNAVIDQQRRRQHLPIDEIDLPGVALSLDDRAIFNDHRRQLSQAIATLRADQQQVIHLRLAGLEPHEIGEVMGKSPGAVRVIHHRAVERLRRIMGD